MRKDKNNIKYYQSRLMLLSLFAIGLCHTLSFAQVSTSIDTTQIRIGEEIRYSILVDADTTDLVVFPEGQTFLPLEMIESYKTDTTYENSKYKLIKKYGLTQFDSGAYTIPSQLVLINETPYISDSLRIEVRDVPVDTLKQKMFHIKPAKPVENPPFDFLKLLYWIIPVLIVAGVITFLFLQRKKRKEKEDRQLPPYEEAIVALRELDNSALIKQEKSKEYYSQLTEIVKRYLDREVDETALESTSDELIARLQLHKDAGHFDFDAETIKQLDQILKRADLVKFAKMKQEIGQLAADRNTVEEIINDTHEVIPEPTQEELLKNEEFLRMLKKKKRRKMMLIGSTTIIILLVLLTGIFSAIYGWPYVKDSVFGHPTKNLLEGNWIRSEYAVPTIILETPEVLKRSEHQEKESEQDQISKEDFTFGNIEEGLFIRVGISTFKKEDNLDFGIVSEKILSDLEEQGASNMIVKREEFSTEEGVEGEKIFGEFNYSDLRNPTKRKLVEYEIVVFKNTQSVQVIEIYNDREDRYASELKKRMFNSVEIEIPGK